MSQFCTSCGKPLAEGAAFCGACGARQAGAAPATNLSPGQPVAAYAPGAVAAPTKTSPLLKIVLAIVGIAGLLMVVVLGSCVFLAYRVKQRAERYTAEIKANSDGMASRPAEGNGMPYLPNAMTKLGDCIRQPTSSFHLSLKKTSSDGFSSSLEEDITATAVAGQQTDVSPKSKLDGQDVGGTTVHPRNATVGTPEWQMAWSAIQLSYFDPMSLREAQPGIKYVDDEQVGGYDARRYDFDLTSVPTSEKAATLMAGKWLGAVVNSATGNKAVLSDYNVTGSAWIARDDGRMVKYQYDYISKFTDGTQKVMHYEGALTKN